MNVVQNEFSFNNSFVYIISDIYQLYFLLLIIF